MSDAHELSRLGVFAGVPSADLEDLCRLTPAVDFPDGAVVFRQDAPADVALLVLSGALAVGVRAHEGGLESELGFVYPGEIVGEQALLNPGGKRLASVTAHGATRCLLLAPDLLASVIGNQAWVAIERKLLASLAARIRETDACIREAWQAADAAEPATTSGGEAGSTERGHRSSLRARLRAAFRERP